MGICAGGFDAPFAQRPFEAENMPSAGCGDRSSAAEEGDSVVDFASGAIVGWGAMIA